MRKYSLHRIFFFEEVIGKHDNAIKRVFVFFRAPDEVYNMILKMTQPIYA